MSREKTHLLLRDKGGVIQTCCDRYLNKFVEENHTSNLKDVDCPDCKRSPSYKNRVHAELTIEYGEILDTYESD
jgi:hypothetical protein